MAIAKDNEMVRVVLPRALVDAIRVIQESTGEPANPARFIRARLATWLATDARLQALEGAQREMLDELSRGLHTLDQRTGQIAAGVDLMRDEIQAAGLAALIPEAEKGGVR